MIAPYSTCLLPCVTVFQPGGSVGIRRIDAGGLASMFEKEVDLYMDEKILQPLRLAIEEDLRL